MPRLQRTGQCKCRPSSGWRRHKPRPTRLDYRFRRRHRPCLQSSGCCSAYKGHNQGLYRMRSRKLRLCSTGQSHKPVAHRQNSDWCRLRTPVARRRYLDLHPRLSWSRYCTQRAPDLVALHPPQISTCSPRLSIPSEVVFDSVGNWSPLWVGAPS